MSFDVTDKPSEPRMIVLNDNHEFVKFLGAIN